MGTVKKIPMRKCVGCGEMKNKKEMLRVLKTPENVVVLDDTGRKNGRGAYGSGRRLSRPADVWKRQKKTKELSVL